MSGEIPLRIALLEDDKDQAELVSLWLEAAGHQCAHYPLSKPFVRSLARESFDLLILDWMLPDMSGLDVLKWVRENRAWPVPVLFVTQRDSERDIVAALEAGADDYMTKPIARLELLARVKALGRRATDGFRQDEAMELSPYRIDIKNHRISVHGEDVRLTQKEYELAVFLFRNVGKVVSRSHLLESVWGTSPDINTRTVDTHMSRIRTKLNITPDNGWRLSSIYQHGYRLERAAEPAGITAGK